MILYFRLLWLILSTWRKPRVSQHDVVKTPCIVLPNDLDINVHMNNARYLSMMDLGRVDYMMRTGLFKACLKRKWSPIVAGIDIKFKKSLEPWERYTLETKLESSDEKFFYLQQSFINKEGKVAAVAQVQGLFISKQGKVTPEEVLALLES